MVTLSPTSYEIPSDLRSVFTGGRDVPLTLSGLSAGLVLCEHQMCLLNLTKMNAAQSSETLAYLKTGRDRWRDVKLIHRGKEIRQP